jgi:truncated hemoglobin YjbI
MTTLAEQQRAETIVDTAALPLFDRIGGLPRIEWLVERFVDEMLSDRDLAPRLSGVDLASLKKTQEAFFTEALGGQFPDPSVDPGRVHVQLEGGELVRAALLLHDTVSSLGLPEDLHEALVVAVISHVLTSRMR